MNLFQMAIERLREDGWCQLHRINDKGQRCLLGALGDNSDELSHIFEESHPEHADVVCESIVELFHERVAFMNTNIFGMDVHRTLIPQAFNDDKNTTVEDVISVLKHADAKTRRKNVQTQTVARELAEVS